MRVNKETKVRLTKELKKIPKDINRMKFINKINDIHGKLGKTKLSLDTSIKDSQELQGECVKTDMKLYRAKVQIENVLNLSTNDRTLLEIRDEYKTLLDIQGQNIKFYQEGGDLSLETRNLEIKNDVLKAKNYQSTLE